MAILPNSFNEITEKISIKSDQVKTTSCVITLRKEGKPEQYLARHKDLNPGEPYWTTHFTQAEFFSMSDAELLGYHILQAKVRFVEFDSRHDIRKPLWLMFAAHVDAAKNPSGTLPEIISVGPAEPLFATDVEFSIRPILLGPNLIPKKKESV